MEKGEGLQLEETSHVFQGSARTSSHKSSVGMVLSKAARAALLLLALAHLAAARPLVRNIKTDAEFKKLLKHHAEV